MNNYDLRKDEEIGEDGKIIPAIPGQIIELSSKQIPELEDFVNDDVIEMKNKYKVREVIQPELNPNSQKANEEKKYKLELIEGGIENLKKERSEAERMGLDKERYEKLQQKRSRV